MSGVCSPPIQRIEFALEMSAVADAFWGGGIESVTSHCDVCTGVVQSEPAHAFVQELIGQKPPDLQSLLREAAVGAGAGGLDVR